MGILQERKGHQPLIDEAAKLLDRIKTAPEDDRIKLVYEAIDAILVSLSTAEWAVWVDRAKALLGKRLDLNKLQKAYNEAIARQQDAAAHATARPSAGH